METTKLRVVTPLRAAPPLTDIAAQLRQLADWIERGEEHGDANYGQCVAAYVVVEGEFFQPYFHAFGNVRDRHGIAGLFLHCSQLALTDRNP